MLGSTLVDLLNALMEQGYRQMTVVGYRYRGVRIEHALEGILDDSPEYVAFEQADGSITIFKKDPRLHMFSFVSSVMR